MQPTSVQEPAIGFHSADNQQCSPAANTQGRTEARSGYGHALLLLLRRQLDVARQPQRLEQAHALPGDVKLPPLKPVPRAAHMRTHNMLLNSVKKLVNTSTAPVTNSINTQNIV